MELPDTDQENRKLYDYYYGTLCNVMTAVDALQPYLDGIFSDHNGDRCSRLMQKLEESADFMDHIGRHMFQQFEVQRYIDHWGKHKPRFEETMAVLMNYLAKGA